MTRSAPKAARSAGRLLVIDDEKNVGAVIEALLEKDGFEVLLFQQSAPALKTLDEEDFDAVITDLYMPEPSGMKVLEHVRRHHPHLPVVMITAHGTVEAAVNALKQGAFDFITKPFERDELLTVVRKAVQTARRRESEPETFSSIIGESPQVQEVFRLISKIAPSPSTVLIRGESGTGKELVAAEIHRLSPRNEKPLVKINCAAIPATLIESEFFGYEKGAFTGAATSKPGRFELADGGTLFLDEVGEMPHEMQVKLLRVIQEQEFERVGGIQPIRVDVRIVAATNRDLDQEVKAGRFREDLFYRLNVVPILLPPLRDRREDIDLLIQAFIQRFNQKLGKHFEGITPLALDALRAFDWPGNIRQLENAIERMILMGEAPLLQERDLPEEVARSSSLDEGNEEATPTEGSPSFKEIVRKRTQRLERELIEQALVETEGNVTRAAEKLGLSRKGLQLKMKELGIRRAEN